jgi:hypothetical protein
MLNDRGIKVEIVAFPNGLLKRFWQKVKRLWKRYVW